jgi:hypothetical protein
MNTMGETEYTIIVFGLLLIGVVLFLVATGVI